MAENEQNFASVEEAIKGAGTNVLSHLGSKAHKLTFEEVRELTEAEPVEGEVRTYDGPYTDEDDPRNSWTAYQDLEAVTP